MGDRLGTPGSAGKGSDIEGSMQLATSAYLPTSRWKMQRWKNQEKNIYKNKNILFCNYV